MGQSRWICGQYRFATQISSPNFDVRPLQTEVTLLVIHSISLPPGVYGGDQVAQLFTNTLDLNEHSYFRQLEGVKVSAHFFVRRDGQLIQFVSADHRAWHAGASSFEGVERCNDFSIGVELEGLEGESFEEAQYETLCALAQALAEHYPLKSIASHQYIAPSRKADPGAGFDWLKLARAVPAVKTFP
jgi:AmpD protein